MQFNQFVKCAFVAGVSLGAVGASAQARPRGRHPASAAPAHVKKQALADAVSGQHYGMAGCGLGSIVFGDKPGFIQVVAATLNGTGGQVFAITSGTSNCVSQNDLAKATELFIENNQEVLKKEIAEGQGESVKTLATLLRCSDSEALGQSLQQDFEDIFRPETKSSEVYSGIRRSIKSNEKLSASCRASA